MSIYLLIGMSGGRWWLVMFSAVHVFILVDDKL
jgi:hypothetical protein